MAREEIDPDGTKNVIKYLGAIFCLIFVILFLFTWSASQAMKYDVFQPGLTEVAKEKFEAAVTSAERPALHHSLEMDCQRTGKETIALPNNTGIDVNIKCSEIIGSQASQLSSIVGKAMFDQVYYKTFDCGHFLRCLIFLPNTSKLAILITETAYNFYTQAWLYFLIAALIFSFIMLSGCNYWHERFRILGIIFLIGGLPYFVLQLLGIFYPNGFMTELGSIAEELVGIISSRFLMIAVLGLVFLAISYVFAHLLKEKRHTLPRPVPRRPLRPPVRTMRRPVRRIPGPVGTIGQGLQKERKLISKGIQKEGRAISKGLQKEKKIISKELKKAKMRVREWVINE